ncbi:acyl-CoA synthetase [Thermocrispum municipale]|uniref:acyl-CoA synthetase n=1 Tax=Thermocrispum municipale TaxID=37926 RepID=UPI000419B970|nr:AMP-binding protein [Thermocrispum municipale]
MSDVRPVDVHELLAERDMSIDEVWAAAEARLDRPVSEGLNTAHEACDRWARDRARLAMIVRHPDGSSERWTFADLAAASSRFATAMRAAGIRRGDRLAALLPQGIEAYIAALAAWRSGVIYMPLFVGFGPDALAERLNGGEPKAIVVDHRYRDAFESARHLLTGDPHVYTVVGGRGGGLLAGDRSFWAEIDRHPADTPVLHTAADEPATLIYTSGTTGPPKGCIQPHHLLLTIQPFLRHTFALQPSDMLFSGANPGWSYGLYTTGIGVMALGCPRVVYTGDFKPADWLRIFEEERVTYVAAAPSAFRQLVKVAQRSGGLPPDIRGATSAGEPLDRPLVEAWRQFGVADIQDGYGQSESAMSLANLAHSKEPVVPGALSSVVPGFDVALVDDDGNLQDEQGIIALRKPRYQASVGYWNAQQQWDARWRGEWFLTGDVARRDEEGRWWFVGRDDDLIVTSGYNVGPTEVENVILDHPGVDDAAVVAAADPDRGSVVRAVVVANGSVPQDRLTEEIQAAVRERVGRHAYPRIVDFVDALPRTESGKIRRHVLRQQ